MTNQDDEAAESGTGQAMEPASGRGGNEADPAAAVSQLQELKDRLLRALADAENARKRAERSRSEGRDNGVAEVVGSIAPALDSLDLAINIAERDDQDAEGHVAALRDGLLATRRAFLNALSKVGVQVIRAEKGEVFDPAVHEAVSAISDPDVEEGKVTETLQAGFGVGPRLIRPARVVVSAAS